jgi:hypothetical protein
VATQVAVPDIGDFDDVPVSKSMFRLVMSSP